MSELPKGFVIDDPAPAAASPDSGALPDGFALDQLPDGFALDGASGTTQTAATPWYQRGDDLPVASWNMDKLDTSENMKKKFDDLKNIVGAGTVGALDGASMGLNTRAAALIDAATGLNGHFGDYSAALKHFQDSNFDLKDENPFSYGMGNAVGSVGAGVLAAPSIAVKSAPLLVNVAKGIGLGGGLGYTQGVFNSPDWSNGKQTMTDGLDGAQVGAAFGAGVPLLARGIGAAAGYANNKMNDVMPGIPRAAANALVDAVEDYGGIKPVQDTLDKLGPLGMLADTTHPLAGLAKGVASKPEGMPLVDALRARDLGTNGRLLADVDASIGEAPLLSNIKTTIQDNRDNLSPYYTQALNGAKAVNTQPLADSLDSSIADVRGPAAKAIKEVRGFLNIPGTDQLDPNPRALLATRNAIDGLMTNETNPQVIRHLSQSRVAVDNELTNAVPGIKDVDAMGQELHRQDSALGDGSMVLDGGKTAIDPRDFSQTLAAGVQPAGTLVGPSAVPLRTQQSVRADINRMVGTKANDLVALRNMTQGEGGWNKQKMYDLYGQEPADGVFDSIDQNSHFRATNNDILGGSQTAQRLEAAKSMDDQLAPTTDDLIKPNSTLFGMGLTAAKQYMIDPIWHKFMTPDNVGTRSALANVLSSQGAVLDAHVSALVDALNRRALNRPVAQQFGNQSALVSALAAKSLLDNRQQTPPEPSQP